MKQEIVDLILRIAEEQNATIPRPVAVSLGSQAPLYGAGGVLDSLALVRFIVEIETAVENRYNKSIILVSERAMSQRRSPFLTVDSLAEYVAELLKEAEACAP